MKSIYGALIRKQRMEKGWTIAQLADRCLIKPRYLKAAEEGDPVLSYADLVLVCNALDISSVALKEGRLAKKAGPEELEALIEKLEKKAEELQESIREMKTAAAILLGKVAAPVVNKLPTREGPESPATAEAKSPTWEGPESQPPVEAQSQTQGAPAPEKTAVTPGPII